MGHTVFNDLLAGCGFSAGGPRMGHASVDDFSSAGFHGETCETSEVGCSREWK